ncbi:hypothetical protein [Streptomyces sp. NBC_01431]|uniref:hypothetical protein n=1 Tax=Streptomyces sp. NBC_01431 TaxID=2903863 RepID=UPI002E3321AC|nr:hypothetical protein [Streptomyces sp. NBC_01431]
MRDGGVGEVVASNAPTLPIGTHVYGELGWQDYAVGTSDSLYGIHPAPRNQAGILPSGACAADPQQHAH